MRKSKSYDEALKEELRPKADLQKTFKLLYRAHRQGDPRATYALGTWYLHGKEPVVAVDLREAVSLLSEAADGDHAEAVYDLAVCYEEGVGVRASPKRAAQLYLKAALLGDEQSAFEVGRCYWHGLGVKRDRAIADVWFERAESLGVQD